MTSFAYLRAATLPDALAALGDPGTRAIGGGTDLLPCIDEGVVRLTRVVDVRDLPGAGDITLRTDGSARVGAGVRLADLAAHAGVRAHFPLLADAAAAVGSPALRNMGTLGGNLGQRMRCWYFRRGVACFKNGGDRCAAYAGEHEYHGIIPGGSCHAVHPSDPAVALEVLDAQVEIAGPGGATRRCTIAELYAGAMDDPHGEMTLGAGELITAVELPAAAADGVQHWEKIIQRGAWDFSLIACAAARRTDGSVRMALGGVGLGPWRIAHSVEEDVASGGLDEDSIDALAERAMYDTVPLARNGYKVWMAQAALRRAMRAIGAAS
ncbi:MAG: FAD binding domain-containing protein [Gemmatimonadetes bacterium]|jgi:xanthine dehydrogenase YagS FAD-binding subunit|nr:FAD binding domain-containing protein [Gemmatimonadota bacterium]